MKVDLKKNNKSAEWSVISNRQAHNSSKNSYSVSVSPNIQFIIDSQPQLPLTGTQFEFNLQNNNYNLNMISSRIVTNDPIAVENSATNTELDTNVINAFNYHSNESVKQIAMSSREKEDVNLRFPDTFSGPIYVIIQSMDDGLNPGNLHPMNIGKMQYKTVYGIVEIKSIDERVRVIFDSIINANACLQSKLRICTSWSKGDDHLFTILMQYV